MICFTLTREQDLTGIEKDFIFCLLNRNSLGLCTSSRTISTRGVRLLDVSPGDGLACSPGGPLDGDQYHRLT